MGEQRLHDRPVLTVLRRSQVDDLPLGRRDRKGALEQLPQVGAPGASGHDESTALEVVVAIDRHVVHVPGTPSTRTPSTTTPRTTTAPATTPTTRRTDTGHAARHEAHTPPLRRLAHCGGHPAPIDTGGIGIVQHTVDGSQRWEKRGRGGRRDLTHAPSGAAGHPIGERREPAVLTLPQAHGEKPAVGIAGALGTDAVSPQSLQQEWIVLPRPARQLPPERLVGRMGLGRQDARAGVCGPARVTGIDHGDLCATGGQLVRRREPDQAAAGDGHIAGRARHGCAELTKDAPSWRAP